MIRKFDLADQKGRTVISLAVVRETMTDRANTGGGCSHVGIEVDPVKATIACTECKAELSPVEWIAQLIEYWHHVSYMHNSYNRSRRAMEMQAKKLERKSRCKCQHCGRVTRVVLPRLNYAELRSLDKPESPPPQEET